MKKTKAIDEWVESTGPVLAAGESAGAADPSMLDQRRRRLVRGAVAIAPLVLTLRSGALAAASCTGAAKVASVELGGNAVIPPTTPPVNVGDVCFSTVSQCEDPAYPSKLSTAPGSYVQVGPVELNVNGKLYCQGGTNKQVVAILSSTSVSSLR